MHKGDTVKQLLYERKRKKRKKLYRIGFCVCLFIVGVFLLQSSLLKIKHIDIEGVHDTKLQKQLEDTLSHHVGNYTLMEMFSKEDMVTELKASKRVEDVSAHISYRGEISIRLQEVQPVGYAMINGKKYFMNDLGAVYETQEQRKDLILLSGFQSVDDLKVLAESFQFISDAVVNQTSEIQYKEKKYNKTLVDFYMYDDNELIVFVEEIKDKLTKESFDYIAYKKNYPSDYVYSFEGKYVYISKRKK